MGTSDILLKTTLQHFGGQEPNGPVEVGFCKTLLKPIYFSKNDDFACAFKGIFVDFAWFL